MQSVSIIIPAYNEENAVSETVLKIRAAFERSDWNAEIIVVDDGSKDSTAAIAEKIADKVIRHPVNNGYGNSLLSGIRAAKNSLVAIADADGSYPVDELPSMVDELHKRNLDMLVGARTGQFYQGPLLKRFARICFKAVTEFSCGTEIPDINSGMRVMRRDLVLQFANMLSSGFSFTTTITIVSFLTYHFVAYRKIAYHKRVGKSHVRYVRDILRTTQMIATTLVRFNPIKFYMLLSTLVLVFAIPPVALSLLFPQFSFALGLGSLFFLVSALIVGVGFSCLSEPTSNMRSVFPRVGMDTVTTIHKNISPSKLSA